MKTDGFFERLKASRIPNFDFAHFRYKLQDGDYRYVEQVVITGEENGIPQDGTYTIYWDLHLNGGSRMQTGVYLCRFQLDDGPTKTVKLIVLSNN